MNVKVRVKFKNTDGLTDAAQGGYSGTQISARVFLDTLLPE